MVDKDDSEHYQDYSYYSGSSKGELKGPYRISQKELDIVEGIVILKREASIDSHTKVITLSAFNAGDVGRYIYTIGRSVGVGLKSEIVDPLTLEAVVIVEDEREVLDTFLKKLTEMVRYEERTGNKISIQLNGKSLPKYWYGVWKEYEN